MNEGVIVEAAPWKTVGWGEEVVIVEEMKPVGLLAGAAEGAVAPSGEAPEPGGESTELSTEGPEVGEAPPEISPESVLEPAPGATEPLKFPLPAVLAPGVSGLVPVASGLVSVTPGLAPFVGAAVEMARSVEGAAVPVGLAVPAGSVPAGSVPAGSGLVLVSRVAKSTPELVSVLIPLALGMAPLRVSTEPVGVSLKVLIPVGAAELSQSGQWVTVQSGQADAELAESLTPAIVVESVLEIASELV